MRNPLKTYPGLSYVLLTLLPTAVCALLLYLARTSTGVAAGSTLPLSVVFLVGALFTSGTYALGETVKEKRGSILNVVVLAAALNLVLNYGLVWAMDASFMFILAPLTAITLGATYPLFGRRAPMLASMTVYVVCTLLANFTFDSFLRLPGYGLLSVGTLFFGVTFTQRDRVHGYGRGNVYRMILAAAGLNLLLSASLGIPLRFLMAGFLAILIAEAADTEVYGRLLERSWPLRVATSNAVSIPLDSSIFTLIAFAGNSAFPPAVLIQIIFADILAKTVVGLLAAVRLWRPQRLVIEG